MAGCFAGATSLATGTDEGVHTLTGVLGPTGFRFLDITATAGDILINELDNNINVVPLPGAIWMFGAGLGGLAC
jgi:hypothetical protein